jgi:hypothetical protein
MSQALAPVTGGGGIGGVWVAALSSTPPQPQRAGNSDMAAERYFMYLRRQADDTPLYLFDSHFADRCPALAADIAPPHHFGADLFALLPTAQRPAFRWLIVGPDRSGSTFHVDPNATAAWNACVRGAKLWCAA